MKRKWDVLSLQTKIGISYEIILTIDIVHIIFRSVVDRKDKMSEHGKIYQ